MRSGLFFGAMTLAAVAAWQITAPRLRFDFGSSRRRKEGLAERLGSFVSNWLSADVRRQADALRWPPHRVPVTAMAVWTVFEMLAVMAWPLAGLALAVPLAYAAWRVAGKLLAMSYTSWQKEMVRGLPGLLAVLRVHLDLGRTVPDAMRQVLPGAPEALRRELVRALSDMRMSPESKDGLKRLAERVDRREWRAFSDTLIQSWDSKLSGSALQPLQDLLQIVRDKEAQETTERLDLVLTMAPGLAIFGVVVWAVGGYIVSAVLGGGGFSL